MDDPRFSWKKLALGRKVGAVFILIAISTCLVTFFALFPGSASPPDPAVFLTVAAGDMQQLKQFESKGGDVKITNYYGHNLLFPALEHRRWAMAEYLFDRGLSVEQPDINGMRIGEYFVQDEDASVLRWLISHGLHSQYSDRFGESELHAAARRGGAVAVGLLLSAGFDPGQRNINGLTPLDIARRGGDIPAQRVLTNWGAPHK